MKKQDILKELTEALHTEESVITIYLGHLKAFASRFDISDDEKNKINELIKIMIEDSKGHKANCEKMISYIKGEKKDDF
jgi:uncharacterized protein (UPF0335 family)